MYDLGQFCGVVGTLITLVRPHMKQREQMLWCGIWVNAMSALNFVLIGHAGSAVFLCLIAIVQLSGVNALDLYPPSSYKGYPGLFLSTIGNVDVLSGFMCLMMPMIGVGYVVFKMDKLFSA